MSSAILIFVILNEVKDLMLLREAFLEAGGRSVASLRTTEAEGRK